jgi:hypothetical protein
LKRGGGVRRFHVGQDATRIYGVLYGAGPIPQLVQNQIYAVWLQKKIVFENSFVHWGETETGLGPTNVRLPITTSTSPIETGNFSVYDTDGTTLLYRSPRVTLREGDVWRYTGP